MKGLAFAFAFALLVGGYAGATEASEAYRVGPRDELAIEIFDHEDLTRLVVVGEDGTIAFPLIESLSVQGLTTQEVAAELRNRLGADYLVNPHVECKVAVYRSQPIQVMGAVNQPGIYYLEGPTRLNDVLLKAKWVDAEKSNGQVLVSRGDQTIIVMLERLNSAEGNIYLEAHDHLTLPEGQFVYVSGEVIKPGQFLYINGLTASQAVTLAGGPSDIARLAGAFIIRNGEQIPVNLKRIRDGKASEILMQPGDELYIKKSAF